MCAPVENRYGKRVGIKLHDRLVALVEVCRRVGFELLDHRIDFLRGDLIGCILLRQKGSQVGLDEHLLWLALNRLAQHMRIALDSEEFDDG